MAIELPEIISEYFAADRRGSGEAVARCFTETGVVKDEGNTHAGPDAIRRWKAEASTKYTYSAEPYAVANEGNRTVVTSHVAGDFPGSPVDLRYVFLLEGDKIAELEITP